MKKFTLLLILAVISTFTMAARDTYAHDASALPQAAQTVLKNNFKAKVSLIKVEKELGRVSEYEVILDDGTEITFDRSGNWRSVETSTRKSVPAAFIPAMMRDYVKRSHPKTHIIGIEKERNGYEVTLSDGVEMKFSLAGQFQKYD